MIPKRFTGYYGDLVRWFTGKVVSIDDPLQLGRMQVRIFGIHTDNKELIPDADLPWAPVLNSIDRRENTLGVQVDAFVYGFFLDGNNSQVPMVFGTVSQDGNTNPLAIGTNELDKSVTVDGAPADPYAAQYPHNKVTQTTSGHIIEIDDTPNAERIHVRHKSGAYVEFHPDGSVVIKTTNVYIDAGENANVKATNVNVTGDVAIDGNVTVTGTVVAQGEVTGNGVNVSTHTHNIVSGSSAGTTSIPNK